MSMTTKRTSFLKKKTGPTTTKPNGAGIARA